MGPPLDLAFLCWFRTQDICDQTCEEPVHIMQRFDAQRCNRRKFRQQESKQREENAKRMLPSWLEVTNTLKGMHHYKVNI